MGESTWAAAQLIRSISKFDGHDFVPWRRNLLATAKILNPQISRILGGELRPAVIQRRRNQPRASATPAISTRSRGQGGHAGASAVPGSVGSGGRAEQCGGAADSLPSERSAESFVVTEPTDEQPAESPQLVLNQAELNEWDNYNEQLFSVLFLSTKGAANSFLVRFDGREGRKADGRAAWAALNEKHLNSSAQRRRILMRGLQQHVMSPDQDPDDYITEMQHMRDELEDINEPVSDARMTDLILEGLADEYEPIRFAAEKDPELTLREVETIARNMYVNRLARGQLSTAFRRKGRESAMVATSNTRGNCNYCHKSDHSRSEGYKLQRSAGDKTSISRYTSGSKWCSVHKTDRHDNKDCRAQQQDGYSRNSNTSRGAHGDGGGRQNRGSNNGRQRGGGSNSGQANTAATADATTTATAPPPVTTATATPAPSATTMPYNNLASAPPSGIGYSFLAAGSPSPGLVQFTMTSDCGASSHFVDGNLIKDIESRMINFVKLDPPATIVLSGKNTLAGVSMGTLTVRAIDDRGIAHDIYLPAMNMPGLGRHLFSGGTAALKGVKTIVAKQSYLDVGTFKIPLRKGIDCPTLDYLDLELAPADKTRTETAFPTRVISGHTIPTGTAMVAHFPHGGPKAASDIATATAFQTPTSFPALTATPGPPHTTDSLPPVQPATAMLAVEANIWQQPPGHPPNERTVQASRDIPETGIKFTDSLTACDNYKIHKRTKQPICNRPGTTEITEGLQLLPSRFWGPRLHPQRRASPQTRPQGSRGSSRQLRHRQADLPHLRRQCGSDHQHLKRRVYRDAGGHCSHSNRCPGVIPQRRRAHHRPRLHERAAQ